MGLGDRRVSVRRVSRSTVSAYERGRRDDPEIVASLCAALGLEVQDLNPLPSSAAPISKPIASFEPAQAGPADTAVKSRRSMPLALRLKRLARETGQRGSTRPAARDHA